MPAGDRTGPFGTGPMSGRGLGFCAGYGIPGYMSYEYRRWSGCLRANLGWVRGFGNRKNLPYGYVPFPFAKNFDEKDFLQKAAENLENELQNIKQRLSELEKNENK